MINIFISFGFFGPDFKGTQKQKDKETIQGVFENVLSQVFDEKIKFSPCSRLDAGVHALKMGANFKVSQQKVKLKDLPYVLNRLLPSSIRVYNAKKVPEDFSSRYDAYQKTYLYLIDLNGILSPWEKDLVFHPYKALDIALVEETLKLFIGRHNFVNFCSDIDPDDDTNQEVLDISVKKRKNRLEVRFVGRKFLRYQVRYMVGAAIDVGYNRVTIEEVKNRLSGEKYTGPRYKAEPQGLYLEKVCYDLNRSKHHV